MRSDLVEKASMKDANGERLIPADNSSRGIRIPFARPINELDRIETHLCGDERPIDELKRYFLEIPARVSSHVSEAYHYISGRLKDLKDSYLRKY